MTTAVPYPVEAPQRTRFLTLRTAARSPVFLIGSAILVFWALCALFGEALAPYDWAATNPLDKNQAPSADHWFGTDRLGRDVFSRVIVGARDVLLIAPLATILGTVAGTVVGLMTGYYRQLFGQALDRLNDSLLALPFLLVALTFVAARGPSNATVVFAIAFGFTPIIARTVRASVLVEREKDYVVAAKLRGERSPYILVAEILPNVFGPIMVEFTVRLGYAIFAVATLSFLGAGVQPPSPDWGLAVAENRAAFQLYWWPVVFPCLAIASLVVAINLVADAVRESAS